MPENFPGGQFFRKADKCFGVCMVNQSMVRGKLKTIIIEWTCVRNAWYGCSCEIMAFCKALSQYLDFKKLDHLLIFLISGLGMVRSPVSELCARMIPVSGLCVLLIFISELCQQHSCWCCSVFLFGTVTGPEFKNKMQQLPCRESFCRQVYKC